MASKFEAPPAEATIRAATVASLKMEAEGPFRRDIVEAKRLVEEKH
ncbi:MAG: hypothetical protein GTO12_13810 [Proteobacteria bacterium]|nr:hypothetical protein [Pseudomonadota bacterium]